MGSNYRTVSPFFLEGVAEIDDSASYLSEETVPYLPEDQAISTAIFWHLASDYLGGLREFYGLTGFTPLLPKICTGKLSSHATMHIGYEIY